MAAEHAELSRCASGGVGAAVAPPGQKRAVLLQDYSLGYEEAPVQGIGKPGRLRAVLAQPSQKPAGTDAGTESEKRRENVHEAREKRLLLQRSYFSAGMAGFALEDVPRTLAWGA